MWSQAAWREVSTAEVVDAAAEAALAGGEAVLREAGMYPSPSVHLIHEEMEPPYLGYIGCREFYRGPDAARAVAVMGILPGLLGVTRLVVSFENDDMCTALEVPEPEGGFATGFLLVDAWRAGHVVRWHPYTPQPGPTSSLSAELMTAIPDWGREQRHPNGPLLGPVAELLATWRRQTPNPGEADVAAESMKSAGYRLRWTVRA